MTEIFVAISHFWPGLYPSERQGRQNPANPYFLAHLRSDRLAFCTYLLNVSLNFDYLTNFHPRRQRHAFLRLQYMHEAHQIVQRKIEQLPERASGDMITDELIASICCLSSASAETIVTKNERTASRFRSPLATIQHLDMWGTAGFSKPHYLAVMRLITLKGGLHRLSFAGLAAIIQL